MTKPDNLLTGFILLLIVERRSGNLDHHPDFAICVFKVGDKSLIIHKSAYRLFSLLISKRGLSSLKTRKTFGKILSGNYHFRIPVIKSDATQLRILITLSFTLLRNITIVITNNRLVSLLPIGSNLVIMSEIINTPATKLLILAGFKYLKKQLIKTLKLRSRIQNCSYNKHRAHQINKYRLVPKGPNLKALKTSLQILNTHANQKRNN